MEIFVKAVIGTRPALLDHTTLDVPWRDIGGATDPNRKLRLGLVSEDPLFPLHPTVRRALDAAAEALRRNGHEIVPLSAESSHVGDAAEVTWKLWSLDNTADSIVRAAGEPAIPSRTNTTQEAQRIDWHFVPNLEGLNGLEKLSVLNAKRAEISADWNKIWTTHRLDAVISPPAAHTAVEHDDYGVPAYTVLLNALDVRVHELGDNWVILTRTLVPGVCYSFWPRNHGIG